MGEEDRGASAFAIPHVQCLLERYGALSGSRGSHSSA